MEVYVVYKYDPQQRSTTVHKVYKEEESAQRELREIEAIDGDNPFEYRYERMVVK